MGKNFPGSTPNREQQRSKSKAADGGVRPTWSGRANEAGLEYPAFSRKMGRSYLLNDFTAAVSSSFTSKTV